MVRTTDSLQVKGKSEVQPRTGHEGPCGVKRYCSTLSLTLVLDGGWMIKATSQLLYLWKRDPLQKTGLSPERVRTGTENFAPTRIKSLDCPAHSKLLYRLCYPGP